jgi:hypothetical protein
MPSSLEWVSTTFEPIRRIYFHDASFEMFGPPQPETVGSRIAA